jgi:hypothetical protein
MQMNGHEPDTARDDVHVKLHALHFSTTGVKSLLEQVAVLAADTLDADSSAGVTVIREGQATTVAASDKRTEDLDEIQYGNGDGPCLLAARLRRPRRQGRTAVLAVDAVGRGRRRRRGVESLRLRAA